MQAEISGRCRTDGRERVRLIFNTVEINRSFKKLQSSRRGSRQRVRCVCTNHDWQPGPGPFELHLLRCCHFWDLASSIIENGRRTRITQPKAIANGSLTSSDKQKNLLTGAKQGLDTLSSLLSGAKFLPVSCGHHILQLCASRATISRRHNPGWPRLGRPYPYPS